MDEITEIYTEKSGLKKALSIVGLILLVGSIAFYAFYLRPFNEDYGQLKADVSSKQAKIAELNAKIASFKSAEKAMDVSTEVQKLTLLNSIPVGVNQDKVIEDLVKVADSHDIELRSVSFGLSEGYHKGIGALKINASFEGNYGDLINFLRGLEQNSRFLKVSSVNVQVSQFEDLDIKKVTFSLSMDAFYQN